MYPAGVGISLILLLWLGGLSYFFWQYQQKIRKLLPVDDKQTILDKFAQVLKELQELQKRETTLNRSITNFSLEGLGHIQALSLSRYNPYGDTGGDQSFTVVLLNGKGTGILLTSLHTRSGTRVYAKQIEEGKSRLHLSKEEQEALDKALQK